MGKRDHGRLVHEIREILLRRGFKPTRITQLETPEGLRAIRSHGFKVEKHNDGKSVRLFHTMAKFPAADVVCWVSRQSLGCLQMKRLVAYNAALEQEGFNCVAINSQNPLAPYSLWRRVDESRRA